MQLFMYEWMGVYVVAQSPDAAWGMVCHWFETDHHGMAEVVHGRTCLQPQPPVRDPRDYLRAVPPGELVPIPDGHLIVGMISIGEQYLDMSVDGTLPAYRWAEVLPDGWGWDSTDH